MAGRIDAFNAYREKMNEKILGRGHLPIKRFFSLDAQAYREGALPVKTKELLGLVASGVLRCDDCITWHVIRCVEEGVTDEELLEALNIVMIVGGSITVPHIRRAVEALEELREREG